MMFATILLAISFAAEEPPKTKPAPSPKAVQLPAPKPMPKGDGPTCVPAPNYQLIVCSASAVHVHRGALLCGLFHRLHDRPRLLHFLRRGGCG